MQSQLANDTRVPLSSFRCPLKSVVRAFSQQSLRDAQSRGRGHLAFQVGVRGPGPPPAHMVSRCKRRPGARAGGGGRSCRAGEAAGVWSRGCGRLLYAAGARPAVAAAGVNRAGVRDQSRAFSRLRGGCFADEGSAAPGGRLSCGRSSGDRVKSASGFFAGAGVPLGGEDSRGQRTQGRRRRLRRACAPLLPPSRTRSQPRRYCGSGRRGRPGEWLPPAPPPRPS